MPSEQWYRNRQTDPGARDPYKPHWVETGQDYGSYMGFPVRRSIGLGGPTGYQINFNGEWMDMGDFQNSTFQQAFVQPWLARERAGAVERFQAENPNVPIGSLMPYGTFGRNRYRSPGPVGSRSGGAMNAQMLQALMAQQGG